MNEASAEAAADKLEDFGLSDGTMKMTPLKAIAPETAEDAAERRRAMASHICITASLDDATNLGLTRTPDACAVASYRKLAWTAGWHLRDDTHRQA